MARSRIAVSVIGMLLVVGGLFVAGRPLIQTLIRGQADETALSDWQQRGSDAVRGAPQQSSSSDPAPGSTVRACNPGAASADAFALVQFTSLAQYNYAAVAGDGDWGMLADRSMVHWKGSPAPGQRGNTIIAFHREPNFEHIDQLDKGQNLTVTDRGCHVYRYVVTARWDLAPDRVNQLGPTSGYDLTLITCTPFWVDTHRLVWRATLLTIDGAPPGSA